MSNNSQYVKEHAFTPIIDGNLAEPLAKDRTIVTPISIAKFLKMYITLASLKGYDLLSSWMF